MIVIPAAGLILSIGVVLFILASIGLLMPPFSYLAAFVGNILDWLIWFQNWLLFYINELPISSIKGLSISGLQFFIIYAIIVSGAYFFIHKQIRYFQGTILWSSVSLILWRLKIGVP